MGKPKSQWETEIVKEAVKAANDDITAMKHNVDAALSDLKMLVGDTAEHWTSNGINFAEKRKEAGLPSMVFNRLASLADQQEGDLRSNQPSCKLRPMGDGATQKLADFREGRIRAILAESQAERAFKEAGKTFVQCGFANWRVVTEYANDRTRNQIIRVKPIPNPFSVIWDRMAQDYFKLTADHVMVLDRVHKDKYKKKYKGKLPTSVSISYAGTNWYPPGDLITIAEYFKREDDGSKKVYFLPVDDDLPDQLRDIWLPLKAQGLTNDQYIEEIPETLKEPWNELLKLEKVHERKVKKTKIVRYLISGHEILEPEQKWISDKYFPIVHVHGKKTNIDGKIYIESVIRECKDSQKLYNVGRNASAENLAMAPKAPYLAAFESIEGFQIMWDNALSKPYSTLYYNAFTKDGKQLPVPQRTQPAQASTAITETTMMAIDEMRSMANIFDPTQIQGAADVAGVAIQRRVSRSEMGNYEFRDNFADSIKWTWLIINDILPKIEDTERQVPIRDIEGKTKDEWINKPNPNFGMKPDEPKYLNDMSQGIYEITATTGPSYATQRMEAADFMRQLSGELPPPYNILMADYAIKYQDYHGASEASDRFRMAMIKAGLGYVYKPEEITNLLQQMVKADMFLKQAMPQQPNPMLIGKVKQMLADTELKMAKAKESLAKSQLTQAEYVEKEMMLYGEMLNHLMQLSMQPPLPQQMPGPQPGQGQLPAGGMPLQ